jgi:hypothetical protein
MLPRYVPSGDAPTGNRYGDLFHSRSMLSPPIVGILYLAAASAYGPTAIGT